MGLASKVENQETGTQYTISTLARADNTGTLNMGDVTSETAIYLGNPSPAAISAGKRPFLIVIGSYVLEFTPAEMMHEVITKICMDYAFKTPENFRDIVTDVVEIDAQLIKKRQRAYGMRKVDILLV